MNKLAIDYVRDILVEELPDIPKERINIYNQKFLIPTIEGAFVVISYKGTPNIISSRNFFEDEIEHQHLNTLEQIAIGIFSKNLEAHQQKENVVMALNSLYSIGIQAANSFRVYRGVRIEDLSFLEASAMLFRFDIGITINAWYSRVKSAEFYDSFSTSVRANNGSPDLTQTFDQPSTELTP